MPPLNAAPVNAPRNALLALAPEPVQPSPPQARAPMNFQALLAGTIAHAAMLSDTPAKWASTIAMLRQNGVDPHGFEDFEKGRPAAMVAAGMQMPQEEASGT
jgi:hypothetical protein